MKFPGFIGPAYKLDSVNVDCQQAINIYPEAIESGNGKGSQVAYYDQTPGLNKLLEVGDGPIRLIHVDSIGRVFVVSGNRLYLLSTKVTSRFSFKSVHYANFAIADASSAVNTSTDTITAAAHGYYTGLKIRVTTEGVGALLPDPLAIDTDYWVIKIDDGTIKMAASLADALSSTAIDLTTAPSDPLNILPQLPAQINNIVFKDINFDTSVISKTAHGLYNGLELNVLASGLLPTGLALATSYFVTNSTANSFQLASSIANAQAGTTITLTDVDDSWVQKLVGADGEYGGSDVILSTSSGRVRAASMSFGGDGTDSSTIFIDGSQNYLYLDNNGEYNFGVLGSLVSAKATYDLLDDVFISIHENFENYIDHQIRIIVAVDSGIAPNNAEMTIEKSDTDPLITITVFVDDVATMTTAQFVEYLSTGAIAGLATGAIDDASNILPLIVAAGGGTQTVRDAFKHTVGMVLFHFLDSTFEQSTDTIFGYGTVPTAKQIVWSDGFFILNQDGTNKFWVSDLQSFNIDTLSFASSEGDPDILLALIINNRLLYAFNEKTTEVYQDTGNADFPFERIGGGFLGAGILAPDSLAKINATICWLARGDEGHGIVFAMQGLTPERISTHAIEREINGYANPELASAWTYTDRGHFFYVLNFAEATWVYDLTTKLWHQRAYNNAGTLERHRVEHHSYALKQAVHLVGDYENNKIYKLDPTKYTDDGVEIIRLRSCPHLSGDNLNQMFFSRFQLDMEVGVGLDGGVQGSNPTVALDFSNDGGHTWSSEDWTLADAGSGAIGDYKKRVIWRRLGKARDRVFRIKISDPVKIRLIDAYIDVTQGVA